MRTPEHPHHETPITIIGSGLAGYGVAKEYRKLGGEGPIVLYTVDGGEAYSKPMLSNALGRGQSPEDLPTASATKMAEDLKLEVRTRTRITALDLGERTVHLSDEHQSFGRLILALGADPIPLELSGDATQAVLCVNDLDDYRGLRRHLADRDAKRILLIGAGLIGCEFANDLTAGGFQVQVVEALDQALGRLVPKAAGDALVDALAAMGVKFHFGDGVKAVNAAGAGVDVHLSSGARLSADVVLSAVGLQPRTQLAHDAGLETNRGIVVDRSLQTSASDIYALGDCMEIGGRVMPYIMPIMHAARALAQTLSGKPTPVKFPAMPVVVKTPAHPVVVAPPPPGQSGEWAVESHADGVRAQYRSETGLHGFVLTGNYVRERAALARDLPPVLD